MNFLRQYWGIILIVFPLVDHAAGLKTFYASDFCPFGSTRYSGIISLGSTTRGANSSGILRSTRYASYPANLDCTLTVQPPLYHGVVVSIRKIDFRLGCVDSVKIQGHEYCYDVNDFNSATSVSYYGPITIVFKSGSSFSGSLTFRDGFELSLTAYNNAPCSSSEYQCRNYRCISKYLTCDGRNHCGDQSDNSDCASFPTPVGKTVGAVFGSIFFVIAIIAGIVYLRSRRNRVVTTTTVHPPPPPPYVQQPYPSAYPSQPQYMPGPHPQGQAVNPLYK